MTKNEVAVRIGNDARLHTILTELCEMTGMGFAAVARVTEKQWIVCQVEDRIEFGLNPGDELDLKTTICDEIRESGNAVVIDHVSGHIDWRTHHTPILYGFESYVSVPIILADGSFFGTLCAIDPHPRALSAPDVIERFRADANRVAAILGDALPTATPSRG